MKVISILLLSLMLAMPVYAKGEKKEAKQLALELELLGGERPVTKAMREAAMILWMLEETK